MAAVKSDLAKTLDGLQAGLRPLLKEAGFKVQGRTFNRQTPDGLTQAINLQMGSFDPPGMTYISGLRENFYGKFTVNLGVFIPEMHRFRSPRAIPTFVQEHYCHLRTRLGSLEQGDKDVWWEIRNNDATLQDIWGLFLNCGFPFFARFDSRDAILREEKGLAKSSFDPVPRITSAIILVERGDTEGARALLNEQVKETRNPGHPAYVRSLAERLALGALDD